ETIRRKSASSYPLRRSLRAVMLRLNSPPRCRSSGTGWKLARVRCVAGSNTSLRHLFCKSVVIAHPKRQFLISSIRGGVKKKHNRSEEHTSELQSRRDLVCRLLLEKKKEHNIKILEWI